MADKPTPMDAEEVQASLAAQITDAADYCDNVIGPLREKATEYYLGRPFGDEKAGQSQVVSTDVRDTVRAILPNLMRVFFGSERYVEFAPRGPEDEAVAEQASDYVNYILKNDNDGFGTLYSAFKDALIRKTGVVKFWWDESEEVTAEEYCDLDADTARMVLADSDIEAAEVEIEMEDEPQEEGEPQPSIDIKVKRRVDLDRVRIAAIPPEEFLIDRRARDIESAVFVAHRSVKTVSELVAMGYDYAQLTTMGDASALDMNIEAVVRRPLEIGDEETPTIDPSLRQVLVHECYIRMDKDGDGIAELRRIVVGGAGNEILTIDGEPDDRIVPEIPFAVFCPDPEPHTFFGQSYADFTMDLQRIKSALMRQMLNNLYLANNPAMAVVEGQVQMDDVLADELGRVIRMRQAGAVTPLAVPFVAQGAFPMLEYLDYVRENRTGITKASMGLDADALQSTTKAAVNATISASQGHIELLARVFAEGGMKRLMRGILGLVVRHQERPRVIRLRGQWVPMDPRTWHTEMDVIVNVALGRGNDEERLQALQYIAGKQEMLLNGLGPQNPLVSVGNYRATLAAITELAGFRDANRFWLDPAQQPPQPPQESPPDPRIMEMQAKLQLEQAKAQTQAQIDAQKAQTAAQIDMQKLQADLAVEREKIAAEMALKREQMMAEIALKREQMMAEIQLAREAQAVDLATKASVPPVQMGGDIA